MRHCLLLVCLVFLIGCELPSSPTNSFPEHPNIVMIFSDDHGYEDSGAYGNSTIQTPNIDRIAREGLRFTRMYTTSAMCTPSRSSLYTGLYPTRNGAFKNHSAISQGIKSIPHYLNDLGYKTGLLGKRHIKPVEQFPFTYLEEDSLDAFLGSEEPYILIITPDEPHAPASMTFDASKHYDPDEIALPPYLVDTPETRIQRTGYYDLINTLDNKIGEGNP